jgi:hypothetical protein
MKKLIFLLAIIFYCVYLLVTTYLTSREVETKSKVDFFGQNCLNINLETQNACVIFFNTDVYEMKNANKLNDFVRIIGEENFAESYRGLHFQICKDKAPSMCALKPYVFNKTQGPQ